MLRRALPVLVSVLMPALALSTIACGGAETDDQDYVDSAGDALHPARNLYTLQNAPFSDGKPTALVYLAKGFKSTGPLNLVVHFHGWANCIENDVESTNTACTAGQPARYAHNLIGSVDASGANTVFIAIERAYDQNTSSAGRLVNAGLFRAMILELLPKIGALAGRTYTEADLGKIVLTSHSGGYIAVAMALDRGGLTSHVSEVILLDSLYGNTAEYDAWVKGGLGNIRFATVYTGTGGTLANAQAMATRAKSWANAARLPAASMLDDRTTATLADGSFEAPLFFKRSGLAHDQVVAYYLPRILAHAGLK
ncbi:MAG: hypothetical protein JST92_03595 [Deltaproteobacteria bacterium]|nr:hypothetical protein [Deltaproteobacteria bacterium]